MRLRDGAPVDRVVAEQFYVVVADREGGVLLCDLFDHPNDVLVLRKFDRERPATDTQFQRHLD